MLEKVKEVVKRLEKLNKTISTMESCTGGGIAYYITNIEGSSNVLSYSAVTYSDEFKIKMGVPKEVIDQYTVYSMEVAHSMSKAISNYANSNYGVGVTGMLNCIDPNYQNENPNKVYISIYDKDKNLYHTSVVEVFHKDRILNKNIIIEKVMDEILSML